MEITENDEIDTDYDILLFLQRSNEIKDSLKKLHKEIEYWYKFYTEEREKLMDMDNIFDFIEKRNACDKTKEHIDYLEKKSNEEEAGLRAYAIRWNNMRSKYRKR